MTWFPRPYQQDAIDAVFDYWETEGGSPLIVIPTGGGKAGVLGTVMRRIFDSYPDMRIVNLAHVAELVEQNYNELMGFWEWAPAGIYSAGLNRREAHAQILFAGIQSVWNKAHLLGAIDLLIIDEAHMVPRKATTTYVKFINAVRQLNPDCRLLGLTATDYRLDSGRLAEGEDRLFDAIAHEVGIRELIDEGYLTPLTSKATATRIGTTGIKKTAGDWNKAALEKAVDKDEITAGIVDDIVSYGHDRRSWLVFAAGKKHAEHLRDEIRRRGFSAECITDDTSPGDRKQWIADFKAYRLRAIVNMGVLTTGFNHPGVDLIAAARPTESPGLYVQIAGRGTRNCYAPGMPLDTREERLAAIAAGPKPNCLFLDFGGLVRRHGPVDKVEPRRPGKGGGDAPVKTCPTCMEIIHASVTVCPSCDHAFERELSEKITKSASAGPILSKSAPSWVKVTSRRFYRHEKYGAAPSVRVEYLCGLIPHKEWVAVENANARGLVAKWWKEHKGAEPAPETVDEMLDRVGELRAVDEVRIEPSGKYFRITGKRFGGDAVTEVDDTDPPVPSSPPWARKAKPSPFEFTGGFR